jgi:RHS repeat-associated protein
MTRYQDAAAGARPVTSSWRFDSLGQLLELDEPDSVPQLHTYSHWGELLDTRRLLTAGGMPTLSRVVNTYDALGRVIHREQQDNGVTDAETVNDYLYDEAADLAPQVTPTNLLGRLALATSPTGSVSFSYDAFGQVNARTFTDNHGGLYVEKHTSHADGSPQALDLFLPDTGFADEHVDYRYDSAGRGRSVTYTNGPSRVELFNATSVDAFGRVQQARYGQASYGASYADVGRRLMTQVTVSSPLGSRAIIYQGYDPMGRERSRREVKDASASGVTMRFAYDALGRLSTASQATPRATVWRQQFTYDDLGNLLGLTNTAGGGSPATNTTLSYLATDRDRICRIGYGADRGTACNVTYDQIGNIVAQPTRTGLRQLSYLADGSVRRVVDGGTAAHFRYDAFGEVQELDLTSSTSPDTRHDRRYGGLIAWRAEEAGASPTSVLTRTIPGPDGFVATRHGADGPWVFAFGEARGNRFFTDETGAFVQDVDYSPFGEPTSTGAQPGSSLYSHDQWNGGDALAALGVSHLGARLYDPVIGRFLSRDPLLVPRTAATTNPYAFAMNDPVNRSDPSGLDCIGVECSHNPGGPGNGGFDIPPPGQVDANRGHGGTPSGSHYSPPAPPRPYGPLAPTDFVPPQVRDLQRVFDPVTQVAAMTAISDVVVPIEQAVGRGFVEAALDSVPLLGTYRAFARGDYFIGAVSFVGDLLFAAKVANFTMKVGRVLHGLVAVEHGAVDLERGGASGLRYAEEVRDAAGGARAAAGQGFRSFSAFKRAMGSAGEGMQWHHVVEQTPGNVARFGGEAIHNTGNLVRLEAGFHRQVSGLYSSIRPDITGSTSLTVRRWLGTQSFEAQASFGQRVLQNISSGVWP